MFRLSEKRQNTFSLHSRIRVPEYVPYLSSNLLSIKVPMLLPRGFSANFILLIWYLCGGVCLWGFEGNILALMMKQVFEDPVDSAQDIIDRGLIPIIQPGGYYYVWQLSQSGNQLHQDLAKIIVVPKDMLEFNYLLWYHVLGNATHVLLSSYFFDREDMNAKEGKLLHFSQEVIEGFNPYQGWIQNKLFHLNDELAKHILIYQQVY